MIREELIPLYDVIYRELKEKRNRSPTRIMIYVALIPNPTFWYRLLKRALQGT